MAFSLLALTSCAAVAAAGPAPRLVGESITYKTSPGPFCGRCDTILIVAGSDGQVRIEEGYWAGRYRDWRTKRRTIRVSTEQFGRFREVLAPYRPAGDLILNDRPACQTLVPDSDEVDVTWRGDDISRLKFYFGCDVETRSAMAGALREAPSTLGL